MKTIYTLLLLSSLLVAKTQTNVTFTPEGEKSENEYGETLSNESVTVTTKNFTVDRFWDKFRENTNNQAQSDMTLSTQVHFELTTQNTFVCTQLGLDQEGCSGQKPFFVNSGTFDNHDLRIKADGSGDLPAGEYRIPFDEAANFSPANKDAFYALDVYRDEKYYNEGGVPATPTNNPENFLEKIFFFFQDYFTTDFSVIITGDDYLNPIERQRYIANIITGLQQSYKIKKGDTIDTTTINGATDSLQPTLLSYDIIKQTTEEGCKGWFFQFDPDSATCKVMGFFGMDRWMPFYSDVSNESIETSSTLTDTETSLLSLAGALNGKNYKHEYIDPGFNEGRDSFLKEFFKPMLFMGSGLKRFFLGSSTKELSQTFIAHYDFKNDKKVPLTFVEAAPNGEVEDFRHFLLMGLESAYGTEVTECKVHSPHYVSEWSGRDKIFRQNVDFDTALKGDRINFFGSGKKQYYLLRNGYEKLYGFFGVSYYKYKKLLSSKDVLDWCSRKKGIQSKNILVRVIEKFKNTMERFAEIFLGPKIYDTYEAQVDQILAEHNWKILEYKEKVHKGLILHLKEVNSNDIQLGTAGTTTTYKVKHINTNIEQNNKPKKAPKHMGK